MTSVFRGVIISYLGRTRTVKVTFIAQGLALLAPNDQDEP
jgi:hypothetical protein